MKSALTSSSVNIAVGFLALMVIIPLIYAQRPQPTQRATTARAPAAGRSGGIDRVNHGTIRHVDTHIVQRPAEVHHEVAIPNHVLVHRDVDVDIRRPQFWHGFVFGARFHGLRPGYARLFVGGVPYYYDDGMYYQQAGSDYQVVYPPVGAVVQTLPDGAVEIDVGSIAYYYAGGAFYVQQDGGFVIAVPPIGVTVPEPPPGASQVSLSGGLAYQFNGIYYQPVFVNGVTQYMTVAG